MCSIRKQFVISAAALMSVSSLVGCQNISKPPAADEYNNSPLVIDEAMQRREWEAVNAPYESGDFVAGPTGFWYAPKDDLGYTQRQLVESPMFVGQVILLPYTLSVQPPWSDVVYRGAVQEPT